MLFFFKFGNKWQFIGETVEIVSLVTNNKENLCAFAPLREPIK